PDTASSNSYFHVRDLPLTYFLITPHLLWLYKQYGQSRTRENPFGYTAHDPPLKTSSSMCREGNEVAATEDASPLCIFSILRNPDDGSRHIILKSHRPGDRYLELRGQPFSHMTCYGLQVI